MGFEVVFKYHDKIENGYDTLENKTFKKKFGDPYEDVPLSKLALFIMGQLARRDIWIVDVEINEFIKKSISFRENKSGIIIKNNKFTGEYIPITGKQNSKLVYLNEICKQKKLNKYKDAICVGDGANDLGMLQNSGLGIGYYPHSIVKKAVDNNIQFTDLKTILFYLGFTEKEFSK